MNGMNEAITLLPFCSGISYGCDVFTCSSRIDINDENGFLFNTKSSYFCQEGINIIPLNSRASAKKHCY